MLINSLRGKLTVQTEKTFYGTTRPFSCEDLVILENKKKLFQLCISKEYLHIFREGNLGTVMVSLKDSSVIGMTKDDTLR